jgi:hypothetical protein
MKTLILIFSISLLMCFPARGKDCNDFGAGVSISPRQRIEGGIDAADLRGDYNGDGIADRMIFLRLIDRPVFSDDVKVVHMFDEEPVYPTQGSLAIGIILNHEKNEACEKYIIYNDFFFELGKSGMWESPHYDYQIGLVKKGNQHWQQRIENLKHDALIIMDESAEGLLLYFDGTSFVTQWDSDLDP